MKILTRRNAMLGWATWKAAKGIAKYQKAKKAIPTPSREEDVEEEEGREGSRRRRCGGGSDRAHQAQARQSHGGDYHAPDSSCE